MAGAFPVLPEMLIALCDAALTKDLEPCALVTVGFALTASDRFTWHGEQILGDVIADWCSPEINYPLNPESVRRTAGGDQRCVRVGYRVRFPDATTLGAGVSAFPCQNCGASGPPA